MQKLNLLLFFLIFSYTIMAQSANPSEPFLADSSDTRPLREVVVKAYEQKPKVIRGKCSGEFCG